MSAISHRSDTGRRVTGRFVLVAFLAFFAVMFAVNGVMIHFALSTFGGREEIGNAWKAGVAFKDQIAAADAQDKLGWTVTVTGATGMDGITTVEVAVAAASALPADLVLRVEADHPANGTFDTPLAVKPDGKGGWRATGALRPGLWSLVLDISRDGERLFRSVERVMVKPGARLG